MDKNTIPLLGIHHVTAIAGDARDNLRFYTQVLGLRLVKKTVNFDAPDTYHFYFGDRTGGPGTILTFFPHGRTARGRRGSGEVTRTTFAVPPGSLDFWRARLATGTQVKTETDAIGRTVLAFDDHDGTSLGIVEAAWPGGIAWTGGGVPAEHAIRGIDGVQVTLNDAGPSLRFYTEQLGFTVAKTAGDRTWLTLGDGAAGRHLELRVDPTLPRARMAGGSVHHVAWRVADRQLQDALRVQLDKAGYSPTPIVDRNYFESIYFREPGGVIFEVATDGPGFLVDEDDATLGTALKLPEQYETYRKRLEQVLPKLD
jgi:glyoxalase family protein